MVKSSQILQYSVKLGRNLSKFHENRIKFSKLRKIESEVS